MTGGQHEFSAALLDSGRQAPQGLTDGAAHPAGRRFAVYRNNVAVSLTEAMHTAFPTVTTLLGPQNMDGLAGMFLRAHPPTSPLMMHYGAAFPEFLAARPQLAHLGYLPDMARLDLAMRRSYHAADAAPVAPEALALAPDCLASATMDFAPALQLIRSRWPIHDIWRFNTEAGAPKPRAAAQDVIITRPGFDPAPHVLPPGGADWIAAIRRGRTLADALDDARVSTPDFDPAETLTLLLGGDAITALTPGAG